MEHPDFDAVWYLWRYPDIAAAAQAAGADPAEHAAAHFARHGAAEGRLACHGVLRGLNLLTPPPEFDSRAYSLSVSLMADRVLDGTLSSLWWHFLAHGPGAGCRSEGELRDAMERVAGGQPPRSLFERHNGANFLAPTSLEVTPLLPTRVAMVGACQISAWGRANPRVAPGVTVDVFLGGGPEEVAPETAAAANYDFQVVQVPTREVMDDAMFWHLRYDDLEAHERAFTAACRRLEAVLHQRLGLLRTRGLLTFVTSFLVPQANPNGRLFPRYDLRNPEYFMSRLNEHLESLVGPMPNCHILDLDRILGVAWSALRAGRSGMASLPRQPLAGENPAAEPHGAGWAYRCALPGEPGTLRR